MNDKYALDELIHRYMDDEAKFDEIVEFCDELEPNSGNKQMLLDCIDCFDIDVLYETLFNKFGGFLSAEEKAKYKEKLSKAFDQALYSDECMD